MIGCPAEGDALISLDDTTAWDDEGDAYDAYYVCGPVDFGRAGPYGKLRRIVQSITLGGSTATITITPIGDDQSYDDQAHEETLVAVDGTNQRIQADPAVTGQRFQYRVDVEDFDGLVEFGTADITMIPKRSGR